MTLRWAKVAALGLGLGACVKAPEVLPPEAIPGVTDDAPVWTARGPGDLYEKGAVRAWVLRQGDQEIGRSFGRYAGLDPDEPKHHVFETRIELELPGRPPVRSEGRVVVDAKGHLVSGFERSDAAEIEFARVGSLIELKAGRLSDEVTYDPGRHDTAFWADTAILHEEMMLAMRDLKVGPASWRLISLSGGVPVEWEAEISTSGDGVVWLDTSLGEEVQFRDGRIVEVQVKADGLEVESIDDAKWPAWTIAGPRELTYEKPAGARFTARPIEVPGDDKRTVLAGEVLVPDGDGPFPGVVFLSGAGQQDRYGFAGPPPVDLGSHFITDALANAGFVVLRYDEPGFGQSPEAELSFARQVDDAQRALSMLLVQDAVDPDRVAIVGHGEGGWRALMVASGRKDVRAVALLGTPGRPYREVMLHQAEATLVDLPPAVAAEARATSHKMLDAIESGERVPPELQPQVTWLLQIFKVDPLKLFDGVRARVLLAQGGKDFEVDPRLDVAALERAAKKRRARLTLREYPDLDHLFMEEKGTSSPVRYLEEAREVDPAFLKDLVEWMRSVLSRK